MHQEKPLNLTQKDIETQLLIVIG